MLWKATFQFSPERAHLRACSSKYGSCVDVDDGFRWNDDDVRCRYLFFFSYFVCIAIIICVASCCGLCCRLHPSAIQRQNRNIPAFRLLFYRLKTDLIHCYVIRLIRVVWKEPRRFWRLISLTTSWARSWQSRNTDNIKYRKSKWMWMKCSPNKSNQAVSAMMNLHFFYNLNLISSHRFLICRFRSTERCMLLFLFVLYCYSACHTVMRLCINTPPPWFSHR